MTRAAALLAVASILAVPPSPAAYVRRVPTKDERQEKDSKRAERKVERQRKKKARRDRR